MNFRFVRVHHWNNLTQFNIAALTHMILGRSLNTKGELEMQKANITTVLALFALAGCVSSEPSGTTWTSVNDAAIRMALNDRAVVYTNEGNQQIGGRQSWSVDGTTRTAAGNVGVWTARGGQYCSRRAAENEPLPSEWDCFAFAITTDGTKMRFGEGAYTWVGQFVE
jgi:hypothetical protein